MKKYLFFIIYLSFTNIIYSQIVIDTKTEGGVSVIPCKVNGLSLSFIFDTGASDVSISMTEASFMLKNGYLLASDIVGSSKFIDATGTISEGIKINLREIEIGGVKITNVKASVVNSANAPLLLGRSAIDSLGSIEFDFKNKVLKIYKNKVDSIDYNLNLFSLGESKIDEGNYEDAILLFSKIIDKDKSNLSAYLKRAFCHNILNNYLETIQDVNVVLKNDQKNYAAFNLRGRSYLNLNLISEGLTDLNTSIRINPKYVFPYHLKGEFYFQKQKNDSALYFYNKAISVDSSRAFLYGDRALFYFNLKNYKLALRDYNKAIMLDPTDYDYLLGRAETYIEMRNTIDAKKDLEYLIRNKKKLARTYYLMGIIFRDYGMKKEQIEYYQLAKKFNIDQELKPFDEVDIAITLSEYESNPWTQIDKYGDLSSKFYISNKPHNENGQIKEYWCRQTILKAIYENINGVSTNLFNCEKRFLYEFDCLNKRQRILSIVIYDSSGNIILKGRTTDLSWVTIIPDTLGEKLLKYVCKNSL